MYFCHFFNFCSFLSFPLYPHFLPFTSLFFFGILIHRRKRIWNQSLKARRDHGRYYSPRTSRFGLKCVRKGKFRTSRPASSGGNRVRDKLSRPKPDGARSHGRHGCLGAKFPPNALIRTRAFRLPPRTATNPMPFRRRASIMRNGQEAKSLAREEDRMSEIPSGQQRHPARKDWARQVEVKPASENLKSTQKPAVPPSPEPDGLVWMEDSYGGRYVAF